MKLHSKIALVLAVVVLLFLVGWTSRVESSSRVNWEYKAVTLWHYPEIQQPNIKELNDMGDEGWEMVGAVISEVGGSGPGVARTRVTYYFKRPR